MEKCHMFYGHFLKKITMWLNPNHPSMAHLVTCDYPKCNLNLGFHVILRIFHGK